MESQVRLNLEKKIEVTNILVLDSQCQTLRVSILGTKAVVTDNKTVTVSLESMDTGSMKEDGLWTAKTYDYMVPY